MEWYPCQYWPRFGQAIGEPKTGPGQQAGHNLNLRMRTRVFLAGTQSEPGQYLGQYLSQ